MKRSRYSDEQISYALRQAEGGFSRCRDSLIACMFVFATACQHQTVENIDKPTAGIFLESGAQGTPIAPTALRQVTLMGVQLTESSEGFRSYLYNDAVSYCTIGFGHLIERSPCNGREPAEFLHGISRPHGERILLADLAVVEAIVAAKVSVKLNDYQYDSLCDFVFNIGGRNFANSRALQSLNEARYADVPAQLRRWTVAGGHILPALIKRREQEVALFLQGTAPSAPSSRSFEDLTPIDIGTGEEIPR